MILWPTGTIYWILGVNICHRYSITVAFIHPWYPVYYTCGIYPPLLSIVLYLCHISMSNIQYIVPVTYMHHLHPLYCTCSIYPIYCTCGIYPTLGPGIPDIVSPGMPPNTRKLPLKHKSLFYRNKWLR